MNTIDKKAKNDVWLDDSWETDEIATRVMEILEQTARAYAVEELEYTRGFCPSGYTLDRINNRIKELRGDE